MKFSIRDLFLVTMIVALAVGWSLDHWRLTPIKLTQSEVDKLERKNKLLEGYIYEIDNQLTKHGLQLDEKFSGGTHLKGHMEVVPLDKEERRHRDSLPDPRD